MSYPPYIERTYSSFAYNSPLRTWEEPEDVQLHLTSPSAFSHFNAVDHPPLSHPPIPSYLSLSRTPNLRDMNETKVKFTIEADHQPDMLGFLRGLCEGACLGVESVLAVRRTCTIPVPQTKKEKSAELWVPPRERYEVELASRQAMGILLKNLPDGVDIPPPMYNPDSLEPVVSVTSAPEIEEEEDDLADEEHTAVQLYSEEDIADETAIETALMVKDVQMIVVVDFLKFLPILLLKKHRLQRLTAIERERLATESLRELLPFSMRLWSIVVDYSALAGLAFGTLLQHQYRVQVPEEDYAEVYASLADLPAYVTALNPPEPRGQRKSLRIRRSNKRKRDVAFVDDNDNSLGSADGPSAAQRLRSLIPGTTTVAVFGAGAFTAMMGFSMMPMDGTALCG